MKRRCDRPLAPGEQFLPQGRAVLQIIDDRDQVLASFGIDIFVLGQFQGRGYALRYGRFKEAEIFVPGLGSAKISVGLTNSCADMTFSTLEADRGGEIKVSGDYRYQPEDLT